MSAMEMPGVSGLNDCGCAEGTAASTPVTVSNVPGLSSIVYRAGTHSRFKASMLARLSQVVGGLAARTDDDLSIAILDAWATVSDVLTFYQERIANECYIGTAEELVSLRALARLIGYVPRPAIAASTYLAFTLLDATGAQTVETVPTGTKVQSIPGPSEQPQTFETIADAPVSTRWNAIKPALTVRQPLTAGMDSVVLIGANTTLKRGDSLLLILDDLSKEFHRVGALETDHTADATTVFFEKRGTAVPAPVRILRDSYFVQRYDQRSLELRAIDLNIDIVDYLFAIQQLPPAISSDIGVYALRTRASLFGHNAPDWNALSNEVQGHFLGGDRTDWPFNVDTTSLVLDAVYGKIAVDSYVVAFSPKSTDPMFGRVTSLDEVGASGFALSSKATRIAIAADGSANPAPTTMPELRSTTIYAQTDPDDFITAATLPKYPDRKFNGVTFELDGLYPGLQKGQALAFTGVRYGPSAESIGEIAFIDATAGPTVDPNTMRTTITLQAALAHDYVAESVVICANLAPATHGDSKQETLGSGDAGKPYQRFDLKQSPLTYLSASSGAASTLTVRVNGQAWREVPSLFGRGPRDAVYITSTDEAGTTTVEFGDGSTGARPPTGANNIDAAYRKGSGTSGNLKAGQLSMLMTRPLGVKSVTNPAASTGGADGERPGDIRSSAPLTVRTLDRIVSLQDYEDFAAAFPGIAKALATWTWDGQKRGVFITIAGPSGASIDPTGPSDTSSVMHNLMAGIAGAGDPSIVVTASSYQRKTFGVSLRINVDPDRDSAVVYAAVNTALLAAYSFETRSFGQPVFLSEMMTTAQSVAGVQAVVFESLYRLDGTPSLQDVLWAAAPAAGADASSPISPAELLTLGIVEILGPIR